MIHHVKVGIVNHANNTPQSQLKIYAFSSSLNKYYCSSVLPWYELEII